MATCRSLRHIFDNTIADTNSSSSSLFNWKQIKPRKPPLDHSFTEIFGELHFKEHHPNPTSSASSFFTPTFSSSSSSLSRSLSSSASYADIDNDKKDKNGDTLVSKSTNNDGYSKSYHRRSNSFSCLNSGSLQLCTEGLGSESLGDVEDLKTDSIASGDSKDKMHVRNYSGGSSYSYCKIEKANEEAVFPPPISYVGRSGKPVVSYQSCREDGRFMLKEIRTPTQECFQASREDGCLRLSLVQSDEDDDDDDNKCGEDDGAGEGGRIEKNAKDEAEVKNDASNDYVLGELRVS